MAETFRFTTGRWYNRYDPETGRTAKAPAYREGFTYSQFEYGKDYPEQFLPGDGTPVQTSLICAPQTLLLVADVDYPEQLAGSALGQFASWSDAVSTRGSHFHLAVDMTGAPPELWPVQGRTVWGDIKSNGFIAAPGSVHYSGELYQAAAGWQGRLLRWTPELLAALEADKTALVRAKQERWGLGTRLPDGAYLYASGYIGGSWELIPDGGLCHDDELKDLVHDMHVLYGRDEEEVRRYWFKLAGALGKPWTERDFQRHWRRVPAMRAEVLEQDDATRLREDFGLELLPPPLEAEQQRQQQVYEEKLAAPAPGLGPPTPPPADGPFELPGDRLPHADRWLGTGAYAQPFDAGRPTDADNAVAVLNRSGLMLRRSEDTGTWLLRGTGKWTSFPGLEGPRAVIAALRDVLPEGSSDPLKDPRYEHLDPDTDGAAVTALKVQAKNRERFSASSSVSGISSMLGDLSLRHRHAGATTFTAELDTDPEVLWAGGVPWDLRLSGTVPVRAAYIDRNTPHLLTAPVYPDASVPTGKWDAFCAAIWPDENLRRWALRVLSVAFTGYADAVMPVLLGDGGLGKTFLMNLLTSVLGDYGGVMHADLLKPDARLHGSFTLKLKGLRLAFVDEAPGRGNASQEHLKKITGGGKMEGNRMRENPIEFTPTHTLCLAANLDRKPPVTEQALARRARLILFKGDPAAIAVAAANLGRSVASREWRQEMPGVLAMMMREAAAWLADRNSASQDRMPVDLRAEADALAAEDDSVLAWLADGEVVPDEAGTRAHLLHEHYLARCRRHGVSTGDQLTETSFGRRLTELGYLPHRRSDGRYRPLRIVQPGLAEFMGQGGGSRGAGYSQPEPEGPVQGSTVHGAGSDSEPSTPQNPSSSTSDLVSGVVMYGSNLTTHTQEKNTPPHTRKNEKRGGQPTHPASVQLVHGLTRENDPVLGYGAPGGTRSEGLESETEAEGGKSSAYAAEPVVLDEAVQPETAKKGENAQNTKTPPKPKTPRTRLTPEEKLARAEEGKRLRAQARADAKTAKVAELGGRLVQLPAVVLRDQQILEVDAATARDWLEPMLGELSVDVEHSGYPAGHKDYRLRLVQLGDEHSAVVFDPADPAQALVIMYALGAARVLHAHSALADLLPLERAGLGDRSMWNRMHDTVILAKLLDPALCDSDEVGLKQLAKNLLGPEYALSWKCEELKNAIFAAAGWLVQTEVTTPVERSGWANIPVCEAFVRYAASDVMDCAGVWRELSGRAGL